MSKKRGLSLEDKRRVILSIYHDNKEPYNLKEIETIGSRMGVVQQTIKDVNQSLCDDSLLNSDKIGSANFFWSFPSKFSEQLKNKKRSLEDCLAQTSSSTELETKLQEVTQCRQQTAERKIKLQKLESLRQQEKQIHQMLEANKQNDPLELKRIQKQIMINKEATNRWTDNIWTIKKFLTKVKGMQGKEADKMLKITAGFDYV